MQSKGSKRVRKEEAKKEKEGKEERGRRRKTEEGRMEIV